MPKKINDDVTTRGLGLMETHAKEHSSVSADPHAPRRPLGTDVATFALGPDHHPPTRTDGTSL